MGGPFALQRRLQLAVTILDGQPLLLYLALECPLLQGVFDGVTQPLGGDGTLDHIVAGP